ncbi:hypothetical protein [Mobiluncus curtisii]|uniref:hypothetical protein n=1 Tax=Mobiluncus curtisii TaxID=2051 RepID=UPI00242E2BAF|nr:hypothetical protein [Mobiluncus curtisii]
MKDITITISRVKDHAGISYHAETTGDPDPETAYQLLKIGESILTHNGKISKGEQE